SKLNVMALNPALYLFTGRHTASMGIMPIDWYRHDQTHMLAPFRGICAFASEQQLDYIYMHESDYGTLIPDSPEAARQTVESQLGLRRVFQSGRSSIFQVNPQADPAV